MLKRSLVFLLAFPVIAAVALALCWTSLKQSFVEWTLREYCRKSLGVHIAYDNARSLKGNVIRLQGVTISPVEPELSSFGVVRCPEAYVKVGFDFGSKILNTNVMLQNFTLDLNESRPVLTRLMQKGRGRRFHLFDLSLAVHGEGEMAWQRHRSPFRIDFAFGQELEGAFQWDRASGKFRVGENSREFVVLAHRLEAAPLSDLISFALPGFTSIQVEEGWLSGGISLTDDHFVAAVDGDRMTAASGEWKITLPKCHADFDAGGARMIFDSASLTCPWGAVHKIQGQLMCDEECTRLKAVGESSEVLAIADISIKEGKICDGSQIELASESLYGEVLFRESRGFAHFLGDDLELGAIWDLDKSGCQGEAILSGKNRLDFSLSFTDDLIFQNGSIASEEIDLSDLPSFTIWGQTIHSEGLISLRGEFDASSINLDVHADQCAIHGRDWDYTALQPSEGRAAYRWDTGEFLFESEVRGGTFKLVDEALAFHHVSAHCLGDRQGLRFEQCRADCGGIEFGGDVLVRFQPDLEVEFYQHTLFGPISGVQSLLGKMGVRHPCLTLPVSGTLSCGDQGGYFKWSRDLGVIEGTIGAQLSNGMMLDPFLGSRWDQLELSFVYDLREDRFVLNEGKGICETPKGEAIPLVLDRLEISDFSRPLIMFDVWCGDKKRDLVRACGKTVPDDGLLRVVFDPNVTHFGALYPDEFDLCFDAGGAINRFHLVTGLELDSIEKELKQFLLTKALSKRLIDDLQGSFYLRLDYELEEFNAFLHGKHLSTPRQKFQDFQFLGSYKKGQWHIEKFELDDFSLAADLIRRSDGFEVTFLGCRWGETSLFGLDGFISSNWNRIEANLNLVDLNLRDLESIDLLEPFFSQFHPQGSMRAHNGKLLMELVDDEWNIDLSFSASLKNFSLDQLAFQDLTKISVSYQTDKRLLISGGTPSDTESKGVKLELGEVDVDLNRHELWVRDTVFQIPQSMLDDLNAFCVRKFPGAVNSSLSAVLREIRPVEPLSGTVSFSLNPIQSKTKVCFKEGQYRFLSAVWDLKDFTFVKCGRDITLSAKCRLWDDWVRLETEYVGKSFPSGILVIDRGKEQLNIWWKRGGTSQISLDRIEGVFAGAQIDMSRDGTRLTGTALTQELVSQIEIDSEKATFKDVSWKGKNGSLTCPYAVVKQNDQGRWEFKIPRMTGDSFRVNKIESWKEFIDDSLIVQSVELLNVRGPLLEPQKITGSGTLQFHSPHQTEIRSFPFVKEKIQDLSVFKPVSGEVGFRVHDGHLTLTGLTDVVDQRQMFRYCLPSRRQSLIGFDGTVHLLFHLMPNHSKVRMGDLVSVVVEGTLDHPSFSLVKTKELK